MTTEEKKVKAWTMLKEQEDSLREKRLKIEEELFDLLESKEEGSKTTNMDNFKVTITNGYTRKLDIDEWKNVCGLIPEEFWPQKITVSLDEKIYKDLKENHPEYYKIAAQAVTAKPKKPGFKVVVL